MAYLRLTLHMYGEVGEKPLAKAIALALAEKGILTEGEIVETSRMAGDDLIETFWKVERDRETRTWTIVETRDSYMR